jgi:hypothetical protein
LDVTTLTALRAFPDHLERYYGAVPADFKTWRPDSWAGIPSEPFTPIEQICHVRDVEIDGYHVRFRRMLEEANPALPDLDGETLARERDYASQDADQVFAAFRAARAKTLELISTFTPQQLARPAHFNGGPATLRSVVHYLCSHDQQHLSGLQWLLAKIAAVRLSW